jgi:ubiquinone/menaquinone biosynthesis C-methylase UbiE
VPSPQAGYALPLDVSQQVAAHYERKVSVEAERLARDSPVEFAITLRQLELYIPSGILVADVGVGVGQYAEVLAKRDCSVHLVDISQHLLDATAERLRQAGLETRIEGVHLSSAIDLRSIADESCDAVLLLGPLYHLFPKAARHRAVEQAARVLKTGGVLFAAGINRLAYFRDLLRDSPLAVSDRGAFHESFLADGVLTAEHAPDIGFAHLTTVREFRELFQDLFTEVSMLGVESFASSLQREVDAMPPTAREDFLNLIERTAATEEGLASADHFLFIGRKYKNGGSLDDMDGKP